MASRRLELAVFASLLACCPPARAAGVAFDPATGDLRVEQQGTSLWRSGEHGLWRIRFRDRSFLSAADFATNAVAGGRFRLMAEGASTRLVWTSSRADVTVRATPLADGGGTDLVASVTPHAGESLMLDFPARLRFPAADVKDFVYPGRGNSGPGLALNAKFFLPATPDAPHGWDATRQGGKGYAHLYGGELAMRPLDAPAVALKVTEAGVRWLGAEAAKRLNGWKRPVLRPPAKGQSDIVLVDSEHGPYLSGRRFGGTGCLWRLGVADDASRAAVPPAETYSVQQLLPRLAQQAPARKKIALIALSYGPRTGFFVRTSPGEWRTALQAALPPGCTFEELRTIPQLQRAIASSDYLLVLNPYGEAFPVDRPANYLRRLDDLRAFVQAGGNWLETGGYSFYQTLHGGSFLSMVEPYPPLFADFAHCTVLSGQSVALYGVQPRPPHEPWRNPAPFVPGETGVGGDGAGGWFFHAFAAYAKPGATVRTPRVRIRTGTTLAGALADYAAANTLDVPLKEKVADPDTLGKLLRAPLLHLAGSAAEAKKALANIPAPALYHPSCYLKGGFDKEYPDHLPPNGNFGTMAELVDLFRDARARGHLVSPYTNPTWWCDHPRGPSFLAAGEAPLAIGLAGGTLRERYAKNDGWTVCFWHPDVQKANRKTVREFTVDAPVDLLFQDQCGARRWQWDFNAAAPSPTAYAEGMVAMNEEDSRVVPLGTEDGWDQVANRQTALCGCSWRVVPTERRPAWCDPFKAAIPPDAWRIEPVNLRLFHDKVLFYMHDLGAFVTNERVLSWMLALGYNLSLAPHATSMVPANPLYKWYEWLHVLQSRVVSRIAAQPLVRFRHDRAPLFATPGDPAREEDDGVVAAQWGDVSVLVNLGDVPRTCGGRNLAPYGWWIEGPGLRSGHLADAPAFVEAGGCRWVYGEDPDFAPVRPTEAQRTKAPRDRADAPRTLAVLDFGPQVHPCWSKVTAAEWVATFETSALAVRHGLGVVRLATVPELFAALGGQTPCFAILNPYGEILPTAGAGAWRELLPAIQRYVATGGHWIETGGAPFYGAFWRERDGQIRRETLHGAGAESLGIHVRMDPIDEAPVALAAAPAAAAWFPPALRRQIAATRSMANRGLADHGDAPVTPLVADRSGRVWFGFHRLGGWGALWRVGGALPDRELVRAIVPAALEHAFTTPPPPVPANRRLKVACRRN
ncbi:MAG: hypothetical protein ACI4Q3_01495 [Kiritimatiellia bacterium]